ncbi:MAG: helix-turn-helix transcriptional regulator [Oscillospiraceae bacterium]
MTFWEVFSSLCAEIGKKPNPVVKEIGVSSAAIANWKAGSIPNGETLMKIADYFHVSVDYLLGRTNESTEITEESISIPTVASAPLTVAEIRTDGVTVEFLKAFETLNFADKVDAMQFVKERMRKESVS